MASPSFQRVRDRALGSVTTASAVLAASLVCAIVGFVAAAAWPAVREYGVLAFIGLEWNPTRERFGIVPMLFASGAVTILALGIAVPLGVLTAVFVRCYAAPRLASLVSRAVELLAATPSVVFGFFGLTTIVPWLAQHAPPGASLLAGGIVLAWMIAPTIVVTSDSALQAVPRESLDGAHALGLSRAAVVLRVWLPAARPGIGAGVVLALGRALGETMAVLMVCGNVVQLPSSWFDPVRTVTANIALEMGYATELHRATLFVSGLGLIVAIAGLLWMRARIGARRARIDVAGDAAPDDEGWARG